MRPYLKKTLHKNTAGGVAQGEGPKLSPSTEKKKKFRKYPTEKKGWRSG
jgi:hypothetical protein